MMDKQHIKVFIADDTLIGREGLKAILTTSDNIDVVGEGTSIPEVDRLISKTDPDLLIIDLKWFGDEQAGSRLIRDIKNKNQKLKILAITVYEYLLRDARQVGADATITKTYSREQLLSLIEQLTNDTS
ncbi:MAG: response regulator transcription factor [Tissierellales bacterium]|nr:response regulator transcription factor [Tissierellales bacterium]